jgi:hypothetical protein
MRGGGSIEMGTIRNVTTLHTIADVFLLHLKGYSFALNREKLITLFRAEFFM